MTKTAKQIVSEHARMREQKRHSSGEAKFVKDHGHAVRDNLNRIEGPVSNPEPSPRRKK